MNEPKHTKGPYEVDLDPDYDRDADVTILAHGAPIAKVLGPCNFPCLDKDHDDLDAIHEENVATARLFAAAPDLLAALKTLLFECERHNSATLSHLGTRMTSAEDMNAARDAIAKAKGGDA